MKKNTMSRLVLGLIQHISAFLIAVVIAEILFHSYMTVDTLDQKTTYYLNLLSSEKEFEDTDEFADIFQTSVSDIIRYVVVKDQMETEGVFDTNKNIDINRFGKVFLEEEVQDNPVYYELDDLIKWGIYGIEFTDRAMGLHDFVNYFGSVILPENFGINSAGNLYFKGFLKVARKSSEEDNAKALAELAELAQDEMLQRSQLEDLVLSYIIANTGDELRLIREEDGTYTISAKMINNKYLASGGKKLLYETASTWIEYLRYQENLIDCIETLAKNYELYQKGNTLYDEHNSNLKYTVRMITDEGVKTFSNEVGMTDLEDVDITDYFAEFHRYLIYYPENLSYMGINPLSESEIYNLIREYDYAYPESTHIWIAVDTSYSTTGDAFSHANSVFQKIIPKLGWYSFGMFMLGGIWFVIALYLTVTAGSYEEDGKRIYYVNMFDRLFTEFFIALVIAYIYACMLGVDYLKTIADNVFESHFLFDEESMIKVNGYLYFGSFGLVASMLGSVLWYSLVRRSKSATIWKDSVLCLLLRKCKQMLQYVLEHKNSVISTLLPYVMFLITNIICLLGIISLNNMRVLLLIIMLFLDVVVGFYIFRQNSEQVDIVEGIKRIRDGNVEHKLDTEGLHGQNKETALAVNTIGEGIENAVRTSVKDEQMKTDLITNVSHDLKTPLTSIVSYIDLLKRLDIQDETAKSYIEVLDTKANRLKILTDDLVEVSKISSGNIVLNMEILNLTELVRQALGEFSDLLEEKQLEAVFAGDEDLFIYADSRRMWRVIENLFNNVCKYGMAGTRVFIDLTKKENRIQFSMKNISNHKMDVSAEDLTERFFRGDVSRTTEGSGLGLSIAKSLIQVQGGTFELELDGDLFRAIISFHEYQQENERNDQ